MSEKDKLSVSSSAHTVENEKAKKQEKELKEMKKRAAEDEKHAKEQQKKHKKNRKEQQEKAKKANGRKEAEIEKAVTSAGTALAAGALKGLSSKNGKKKGLVLAAILVVGILAYFLLGNQIKQVLGIGDGGILPQSASDLLPDSEMGYNHIDFSKAILGKAREKAELIVLEQDVKVDSEISNALANISLFKKTKKIHSYGTGVYTVNMENIDEKHINVNDDNRTVTVEIPHTVLQYVNIDIDKTEFEKTDKAILGFGDIKMTQEQQKILSQSIDEAMRKELDTKKMYEKADETALLKVREIFQPLVGSVSEEYIVTIVQ